MSEVENESVEVVDVITPKAQAVEYTFGVDGHLSYTQRPLSFFGKMELFSVLGKAIDGALSSGGTISDLLDDVPAGNADEFKEADNFIKSISKLVQYVPDLLADLYVIALAVPKEERDYVKSVMTLHESQGGLTDEQGLQILEVFIDQNWDVLLDFFKDKIVPLFNKLTKGSQESVPSTPSKATRRRTPRK